MSTPRAQNDCFFDRFPSTRRSARYATGGLSPRARNRYAADDGGDCARSVATPAAAATTITHVGIATVVGSTRVFNHKLNVRGRRPRVRGAIEVGIRRPGRAA